MTASQGFYGLRRVRFPGDLRLRVSGIEMLLPISYHPLLNNQLEEKLTRIIDHPEQIEDGAPLAAVMREFSDYPASVPL